MAVAEARASAREVVASKDPTEVAAAALSPHGVAEEHQLLQLVAVADDVVEHNLAAFVLSKVEALHPPSDQQ
jgi:hypothetical protein